MDNLELMAIRADTLFSHDERGRIFRSNELDSRPAPRLFLGYTARGYVIRIGQTLPDDVAQRLNEIAERGDGGTSPHERPAMLGELRKALAAHGAITEEAAGPAYRFPEAIEPSGIAFQVTEDNVGTASESFSWLPGELRHCWPCFGVLCDGKLVSICFSSRLGPAVCEAGLETLPAYRGRGYAAAVTAAWGASVRTSGRIPLYSTSWTNLASQAVARRLRLIMYGADASWY